MLCLTNPSFLVVIFFITVLSTGNKEWAMINYSATKINLEVLLEMRKSSRSLRTISPECGERIRLRSLQLIRWIKRSTWDRWTEYSSAMLLKIRNTIFLLCFFIIFYIIFKYFFTYFTIFTYFNNFTNIFKIKYFLSIFKAMFCISYTNV